MAELTRAQISALRMVARRDWPAGEPRIGWIGHPTVAALLRLGLIEARLGSANHRILDKSPIADFTDAGLEAISSATGGGGEP